MRPETECSSCDGGRAQGVGPGQPSRARGNSLLFTGSFNPVHDITSASAPASDPVGVIGPLTERLDQFLSLHLRDGMNLERLSKYLGYSVKYTSTLFRIHMGVTFSERLSQLRVAKAVALLRNERSTMAQIATSLGFSDAFVFSHFFKRAVGCSPSEFRRQAVTGNDRG